MARGTPQSGLEIAVRPASADRWDDLVEVFGPRGAYDGCWCMYWRRKRKELGRMGARGRRAALKELTTRDRPPGILYYDVHGSVVDATEGIDSDPPDNDGDGRRGGHRRDPIHVGNDSVADGGAGSGRDRDRPGVPFGWCALGPREDFSVLQRSPILRPVDDLPSWSLVCFFLVEPYRGRGLFRRLATLAIDHARRQGAPRIEAYPREKHRTGPCAYMGIADVYASLGCEEVARRKEGRPVLRLELKAS